MSSNFLDKVKLNKTIIDKKRDLIINKVEANGFSENKLSIIQSMFFHSKEVYIIQVIYEETGNTDEIMDDYIECVDTFEIK